MSQRSGAFNLFVAAFVCLAATASGKDDSARAHTPTHARRTHNDLSHCLQTDGFSGAELANIVNEAALLAVRGGGALVGADHVQAAVGRAKAYRSLYSAEYKTMLQVD
jgi:ATP-dependent 26S proteasome regulatory subunit